MGAMNCSKLRLPIILEHAWDITPIIDEKQDIGPFLTPDGLVTYGDPSLLGVAGYTLYPVLVGCVTLRRPVSAAEATKAHVAPGQRANL